MSLHFDRRGDFKLPDANELRADLDKTAERGTRSMANQASKNAPIDTGALKASIPASVQQEEELSWLFGSHLPYAQRQEYEHRTKKAYFRRAIWAGEGPLERQIRQTVERRWGVR
ncbi:HK97 gp10 family phage protein [Thalassobacillus sp. CUG 92003]|uniref:HK97 gp10 family phage protein n=1 Tax=Thalassobacillus sp. CUG 92003 TaxID=2736641 RepID=UPI0015E67155|nr:HK97 gp10 family phage protein [Thalassobacillus sp. CUG 92003]